MAKPLIVLFFENHMDLSLPNLLNALLEDHYLESQFKHFNAEALQGQSSASFREELFKVEDKGDTQFLLSGIVLGGINSDYDDQAFINRLKLQHQPQEAQKKTLQTKNIIYHHYLLRIFLEKLEKTSLRYKAIDWDAETREGFQVYLKDYDKQNREKRKLMYDKYSAYSDAYREPLMTKDYLKAEEDTVGFHGNGHLLGFQRLFAAAVKNDEDKERVVFIRVSSKPLAEPSSEEALAFPVYTVVFSQSTLAEAVKTFKTIIADKRAALAKIRAVAEVAPPAPKAAEAKTEAKAASYIHAQFYHQTPPSGKAASAVKVKGSSLDI